MDRRALDVLVLFALRESRHVMIADRGDVRGGVWAKLVLAGLFLAACAGTVFSLLAAVLSAMAFDAPTSDRYLLSYVIGFGLPMLALANVLLVLCGAWCLRDARSRPAVLSFALPSLCACAVLIWFATDTTPLP